MSGVIPLDEAFKDIIGLVYAVGRYFPVHRHIIPGFEASNRSGYGVSPPHVGLSSCLMSLVS
jgi:hypothetical protein